MFRKKGKKNYSNLKYILKSLLKKDGCVNILIVELARSPTIFNLIIKIK